MEFKEMYSYLLSNHKIRRRAWEEKSLFLMMTPDNHVKCYRQECVPYIYDMDIINSHDWIVVGDEKNLLPFSDVIIPLMNGKNVRLKEWPKDNFLECTPNGKDIFLRKTCEYQFVPTMECFAANDWDVIKEENTDEV